MIESKHSSLKVFLLYFFTVVFLFADLLFKQIRFLNVLIPDFYSIIFYTNVLFCPLKIMVTNLFIIGIVEDGVLNHILGVSSLVYFAFIYPVSRINNVFTYSNKKRILVIFVTFALLSLVKSSIASLLSGGHLQLKFNFIGIVLSSIIALMVSHYR